MMIADAEIARASTAWPFQEAVRLLERVTRKPPAKGYVLFETGYGPSGLPHIGTFGEVARTSMVRHAFTKLSDLPTRLFAFSDDMDGLRKVPENVPNQDMLHQHLGKPLTKVPDPFGKFASFGEHNNAMLRSFLDQFGFDYEFQSATELYRTGRFDAALLDVLRHYDQIMAVMLPSLRAERAATYSPILPISPETGVVLQVPLEARDLEAGTVSYRDEAGRLVEVPVTGGHCKLQWKADWAMRWLALDVDYEMYGKDLIPSAKLSGDIVRLLGGRPPEGFAYELFLDENGEKISKSRGNGLTIEQWLTYASPDSLQAYMFHKPRQAKRLHFGVIPRTVDDYLTFLQKYPAQDAKERFANPVWHIHRGVPPAETTPLSFGLLMNLAGVSNTEDPAVLWGFIHGYVPGVTPRSHPMLDALVGYAIAYYRDFVKPQKRYRLANAEERAALSDLVAVLQALPVGSDAEAIQNQVYEVGKRHGFASLRDWFKTLYEVLLGQEQGPRMGTFFALYGLPQSIELIQHALEGVDLSVA